MGAMLVLLGLVGVVVIVIVAAYNSLIRLRNQVRNAWAQIDVQLKRRYDLIPNLVEVVKDYMGYEQETLQKVIQARQQAIQAKGLKEQAEAEGVITSALRQLFALSESYPDLKANENVKELQEELTSTENRIAFARQFFNDIVMQYNIKIQSVPTNVIANLFGFREEESFDVPETDRQPVRVDLR